MKHIIAKKIMLYLFIMSIGVAAFGTACQLYLDYNKDKAHVAEIIRHIEVSYVPSVSNSLWLLDEMALGIQISGLLKYPDISFIEVKNSFTEKIVVGDRNVKHALSKEFPLVHKENDNLHDLGTLVVVFSMKNILDRQVERSIIILLTETFQILVITLFVFFLFYYMVGRHLETMAAYAKTLDYENLKSPTCFT